MGDRRERLEARIARHVGWAALLLLLALVQGQLLPRPWGVAPNLVLAAVVCWAALRGPVPGAAWAFYGGLWLDLLSSRPLGMHALALLLAVVACVLVGAAFDRDTIVLPLVLSAIATLIFQAVLLIFGGVLENLGAYVVVVVLPVLLLNLIAALIIYWPLRWWVLQRSADRLL